MIYKGIVGKDCGTTAFHYRNELIKIGFPKSALKLGVFRKKSNGTTHVVLILDATLQLFKNDYELEGIKPY